MIMAIDAMPRDLSEDPIVRQRWARTDYTEGRHVFRQENCGHAIHVAAERGTKSPPDVSILFS